MRKSPTLLLLFCILQAFSTCTEAFTRLTPKIITHQKKTTQKMSTVNQVTVLSTMDEKAAIVPALARLSAPTEMSSYGPEQWIFLLQAGDVEALVIPKQEDGDKDLLGCVLRINYGTHQAFGMMLVSKNARGKGLAKKLLGTAMNKTDNQSLKILGTCTEMGRPMYEKMGFQRVGTVTRMTISTNQLQFKSDKVTSGKVWINQLAHLDQVLQLDQKATGLDRSKTLKALVGYPYATLATLTNNEDVVVAAALVTQHTGSSLAMVGPILGPEASVPALLQGALPATTATELALIVADHPTLVQTLKEAGFETAFELGAMTMDGAPLPGERDDYYMGLIHPTLG